MIQFYFHGCVVANKFHRKLASSVMTLRSSGNVSEIGLLYLRDMAGTC